MKAIIKFSRYMTVFAVIASLSSCSTSSHDPAVATARQDFLRTKKTYIQGALVGAAIGAGAGAVIGNQSNSKNGAGMGALIGAGVGALGGLMYAQHVVNQRRIYANASAYLNDCTKVAKAQRQAVTKYNQTLDARRLAIQSDSKKVEGTIKDSQAVLARLQEEIELQTAALEIARSERGSGANLSAQQTQISALRAEEKRLIAHIERLSATSSEPGIISGNQR